MKPDDQRTRLEPEWQHALVLIGLDQVQAAGCGFLDTSQIIATSETDGIHLDEDAHKTLGVAVAQRVRQMIPG